VPESPALRAVVHLQEAIRGCLFGKQPELHWFGSVSAAQFLHVVLDLIRILTHRTAPGLVLADLLVPDEFCRRYNVGGRFQHPQFPSLPWFARFLVLAALNQIVLVLSPAMAKSAPAEAASRVLNAFFVLLSAEQKAAVLNRMNSWPPPLKVAFHHALTTVRRMPTRGSRSPLFKYNTRPGRKRQSTVFVQRIHLVETDSTL
jgi:hypothetical protein